MSSKNCRNDCTTPLRFPRRPGTNEALGADSYLPGERISTDNRPALPHFNYRIGTYGTIREWLLNRIDLAPNLKGWTHREADDPAIALLESAAMLGDILTFYQDLYANEAFLRTAAQRENIAELVRLLGYRLSPGLGGKTTFAFEIKEDEPVTIPAGFPIKATLEEPENPTEFETKEEIKAYPWLSRFNLFEPMKALPIDTSTKEFYIDNQNTDVVINPGDRLMIRESESSKAVSPFDKSEIVIVDSVRELHGTRLIKIKGNLQNRGDSDPNVTAYKLGRAFHHFGHNGPNKYVPTPVEFEFTPADVDKKITVKTNFEEKPVLFSRLLNEQTVGPLDPSGSNGGSSSNPAKIVPPLKSEEFPIDVEVQDLPPGAEFIVEINSTTQKSTFVGTIKNVRSGPFTWGLLSGTTSIVTLTGNIDGPSIVDIRNMLFHEVLSPALTLKNPTVSSPNPAKKVLSFYGSGKQARSLNDRRIMLEYGDRSETRKVTKVYKPGNGLPKMHLVEISGKVDYKNFPQENPLVTVYGNLADANEGKTVPETILGSGDNTKIFQSFELPKTPLTYHIATENTPPETPELAIFINGIMWQRVESFFGRQPDEQIYIVREDDENNSWVQFGDGKTGVKLPTGIENVVAIHRHGTGAFGELKADTKIQAGEKIKNLDQIQMPSIVTGGSEREGGENAKNAAPGKVQSLGRLVSLRDFDSETLAISGVATASAAWQLRNNIPSVVITVLMDTGRSGEIVFVEATLNGYNRERGASRFPITVDPGHRLYVYLVVDYGLDPMFRANLVEPEIRKALGVNFGGASKQENQSGLFSLQRRRFGMREYSSTIEGAVQNVAGVIWAEVKVFSPLSISDDPDSINVRRNKLKPCKSCRGANILSLYDKHLILRPTTQEGS